MDAEQTRRERRISINRLRRRRRSPAQYQFRFVTVVWASTRSHQGIGSANTGSRSL